MKPGDAFLAWFTKHDIPALVAKHLRLGVTVPEGRYGT